MGQKVSKAALELVEGLKKITNGLISIIDGVFMVLGAVVNAVGFVFLEVGKFIFNTAGRLASWVASGVQTSISFAYSGLKGLAEGLYKEVMDLVNSIKSGSVDEQLGALLKDRLADKYQKLKKQYEENEAKAEADRTLLPADLAKELRQSHHDLEKRFVNATKKLSDSAFNGVGTKFMVKQFEDMRSEFKTQYEATTKQTYTSNYGRHDKYCDQHGYTCEGPGCKCQYH